MQGFPKLPAPRGRGVPGPRSHEKPNSLSLHGATPIEALLRAAPELNKTPLLAKYVAKRVRADKSLLDPQNTAALRAKARAILAEFRAMCGARRPA